MSARENASLDVEWLWVTWGDRNSELGNRMTTSVPKVRIRNINGNNPRPSGKYVLYWMIAARRIHYNFALERAVELAEKHGVGLIVLEALRVDYPWASDRLHTFILQGMRDNARALQAAPVFYYPYVEAKVGAGKGLLEALANEACAVVTDDFPCFFLPNMVVAAGKALPVCLEAVDSNGLYPMRATDRVFTTAASFRRHLQKELPAHLMLMPREVPLEAKNLPPAQPAQAIILRYPPEIPSDAFVGKLLLDHGVQVTGAKGGAQAARKILTSFISKRMSLYPEQRNQPEVDAQSHLSPYLHFGHISAHEVFVRLIKQIDWSPERLAPKPNGRRSGWWGAGEAAEAFLDEFITWREIGYNMCANEKNYARYTSLPRWARETLADHAGDVRTHVYSLAQFEEAKTHDPLWNACQRQLVLEGTIHNYLRMLWGKKILEWTRSPKHALKVMVELNNKYALDGRNPNSYSGIFWVLGRYDRAWGPERKIFGKIRYMSSESTARKVRVKSYLERYAEPTLRRSPASTTSGRPRAP